MKFVCNFCGRRKYRLTKSIFLDYFRMFVRKITAKKPAVSAVQGIKMKENGKWRLYSVFLCVKE